MKRVEPHLLAFISVWEASALLTGRVPTITSQVLKLPLHPRRLLVALTAYWLVRHFELSQPRQTLPKGTL